ncbi:hypothetical protein N9Z27_00805 [Alphaproteobacteria bacterium]|nr:hypothetical protein [Alphaproteobacteria bacterium]
MIMIRATLGIILLSTLLFGVQNNAQAQGGSIGTHCEERGSFNHPEKGNVKIKFPCGPNNVVKFEPDDIHAKARVKGPDDNRCTGCVEKQCKDAERILGGEEGEEGGNHEIYENAIMAEFSFEMDKHRKWLRNTFFQEHILKAMMQMTEQLSAVAMHQTMMFGQFIDAKSQLETQRLHQELQVAAHNDYQPSEDFCYFGTNVRSLADTEEKMRYNVTAIGKTQMARHLGTFHTAGAQSRDQDKAARWDHFTQTYCDPKDNNWVRAETGLGLACKRNTPGDKLRTNIDIDYARMIEQPRTLNVDFTNKTAATGVQQVRFQQENNESDEEDILAMSYNLYGHDVLTRKLAPRNLTRQEYQHLYIALRSVAAKRNVAEHSYNSIISLKAKGNDEMSEGEGSPNTQAFLEAVLAELGVSNQPGANGGASEAEKLLGKNPSYYAQLEVLTKMIYQNPDFYANLYDKPANIARKSAALLAIERMLDQALLESQLRQEMSTSVLLASKLSKRIRKANRELINP